MFNPNKNQWQQQVHLLFHPDIFYLVMTNAGQQSYTEEIPMLVVIFVAVTITVLVLVTMLIIANTMKRRIIAKTDFPTQEPSLQIKNYQVRCIIGWNMI